MVFKSTESTKIAWFLKINRYNEQYVYFSTISNIDLCEIQQYKSPNCFGNCCYIHFSSSYLVVLIMLYTNKVVRIIFYWK
jgi:hypothetical protein